MSVDEPQSAASARSQRHRRVHALFLEGCELSGEARARWLERVRAQDPELHAELEALLAQDDSRPERFLAPLPARAAEERPLPERVGRFRIVARLGAGGMGVVYEAVQDQPQRTVALKVLRGGALDERALRRFEVEGEILGRLEHAGIARIYEAGTVESEHGRIPYLAMELVRGEALTRWADARALSLRARLALFVRVCRAVQHAHRSGVIHRDLKPANVLVDAAGEPKVLDFGIALAQDQEVRLTHASEGASALLGTLQYMAPEQAVGASVDARADVYALGVILHELLVGAPPYELAGLPLPEALRRIGELEPPLAGTLRPELRGDLESILAMALAKEPDRRYGSAEELALDLERFLRDEPIVARPPSRLDLARKFARRNKVLVGGALSTLLALVLGLLAFGLQARRARHAELEAQAGWTAAEARSDELLQLSAAVDLRELVARARTLWPAVPARAEELRAWLADARALLARLPRFEETLRALEARASHEPDGALRFESVADRWWHEQLGALVGGLRALADREHGLIEGVDPATGPGVARRLELAQDLAARSLEGPHALAWREACAAIADRARTPAYAGLELAPQLGLVPLGPDPRSGLWEFAHVASGRVPERGADGTLAFDGESAIVLVLVPAGRFTMGAQARDPQAPGYDPLALEEEGPPFERELEPYFLAKHELTQGQWQRFAGVDPARYGPHYWPMDARPASLAHPVELVSQEECRYLLEAWGLRLPSEAEWERGARGGTSTPWWTGSERESLREAVNLAGGEALRAHTGWAAAEDWPEYSDGWVLHAPVDSFRANPFGLHHVLGNVWEWTADPAGNYDTALAQRETYRDFGIHRIVRGGSYVYGVREARCSARWNFPADTRRGNIGVRAARSLEPAPARVPDRTR